MLDRNWRIGFRLEIRNWPLLTNLAVSAVYYAIGQLRHNEIPNTHIHIVQNQALLPR
jgi:hypothetical protein